MDFLILTDLKPQGDWGKMVDFLVSKHNWKRESQPLKIYLNCNQNELIQILNEFTCMVDVCNNIAPIEIQCFGTIVFKTMLIVREGILEPRQVRESENLDDVYHMKVLDSGLPYLLKIN